MKTLILDNCIIKEGKAYYDMVEEPDSQGFLKRFCPDCCGVTLQHLLPYDPDDEFSQNVWTCTQCKESVGFEGENNFVEIAKVREPEFFKGDRVIGLMSGNVVDVWDTHGNRFCFLDKEGRHNWVNQKEFTHYPLNTVATVKVYTGVEVPEEIMNKMNQFLDDSPNSEWLEQIEEIIPKIAQEEGTEFEVVKINDN